MSREFPTRHGVAVSLEEIRLPESRLDLRLDGSFNTHHHHWTKLAMGRHVVTQALRDLARHQTVMPRDVHAWLHREYGPPRMPTLRQAADEVMDAFESMETLSVYDKSEKGYIEREIPFSLIQKIRREYGSY